MPIAVDLHDSDGKDEAHNDAHGDQIGRVLPDDAGPKVQFRYKERSELVKNPAGRQPGHARRHKTPVRKYQQRKDQAGQPQRLQQREHGQEIGEQRFKRCGQRTTVQAERNEAQRENPGVALPGPFPEDQDTDQEHGQASGQFENRE